ncbi:hypothetical protein EDD18DRAFT_1359698 [Armillaria luteobubalina]|uniref:Uncharacterized protein n=1 Tax=Armillaria luteobubalina TaxID=153913 RepID=A0AA39PR13_9AGAR|nr:hypothetical protein EDD18DRAFT_1359698 [Armillaria luteobubalina]
MFNSVMKFKKDAIRPMLENSQDQCPSSIPPPTLLIPDDREYLIHWIQSHYDYQRHHLAPLSEAGTTAVEAVEDTVSICSQWQDNLHLEVETIFAAPLFQTSMKLTKCIFCSLVL